MMKDGYTLEILALWMRYTVRVRMLNQRVIECCYIRRDSFILLAASKVTKYKFVQDNKLCICRSNLVEQH